MKSTTFKNHVVIVTGASSGIGKALALQLSTEGACLSLAARNPEQLGKLAQECNNLGGSAIPVQTDVADQAQCQKLIEDTVQQFGRIDMLANNAGFSLVGKFGDYQVWSYSNRLWRSILMALCSALIMPCHT